MPLFPHHKQEQPIDSEDASPPSQPPQSLTPIAHENDVFEVMLSEWLSIQQPREQRRFLEAHLQLLAQQSDIILYEKISQNSNDQTEVFKLRRALSLLHDIRLWKSTIEAIRKAYINIYGGFVLDLPPWLEEVEHQLSDLLKTVQRRQTAEKRVELLQEALELVSSNNETLAPEIVATLRRELACAWWDHPRTNRAPAYETAISTSEEALSVFTKMDYPLQYALTQNIRGNAYRDRVLLERRTNVEQAIFCLKEALTVWTPQAYPFDYAEVQTDLGLAYRNRIEGVRRESLEQAIACFEEALRVHTFEAFPFNYARVQTNLGQAYWERIAGGRRENLEQAITCFEESLRVRTRDAFSDEYARVQNNLGLVYWNRIAGAKRENLEQAIICFEEALSVHTFEAFPFNYARVQNNLGLVYRERIVGERRENLEQAIACFEKALRVYTLEDYPEYYAMSQFNLGLVYMDRLVGKRRENFEQAIACFENTLRVYTLEDYPDYYASTQNALGNMYLRRVADQKRDNVEQAIAYFEKALQVWTLDAYPLYYAENQNDLGNAYRDRIVSERQDNLKQSIACYHEALRVYTLEAFPSETRTVQSSLAETEARRENWSAVHEAYRVALEAEDLLVALGAGAVGLDAILKEGHNGAIHDGFTLVQLGRIEDAAVAIERGRARGLAEALAIDAADPERISNQQRKARYIEVRKALITVQAALHEPLPSGLDEQKKRRRDLQRTAAYVEAKQEFDAIVTEIRATHDPADFLNAPLDAATILQATQQGKPGHALIYLIATPWGGLAIGAFAAQPAHSISEHFASCNLPNLTDRVVNTLVETRLGVDGDSFVGGFDYAQRGETLELLKQWPGTTFREKIATLHTFCNESSVTSTLDKATQTILGTSNPKLVRLLDQPLALLDAADMSLLACTLNHEMLHVELEHCISVLTDAALKPLFAWLQKKHVKSLTIVPCGALSVFPLLTIPLQNANGRTLSEVIPASVAPSARSLLGQSHFTNQRQGLYALGNPYPTKQRLEWSEAEAETFALVGEQFGLPSRVNVQLDATRQALIEALQTNRVVNASCHGIFDARDFLNARLLLAGEESLTLADMLSRRADLRGLRLLILSACQTAILDLRGARDEVRSLAVGTLQAGAEAVLAALWPVDDEATYLLMVRFAQEWLPRLEQESPAAALARAQNWLRTVTNRELKEWRFQLPYVMVEQREPTMAGTERMIAVRGGRGYRLEAEQAEELVQMKASRGDPDTRPFADPYYWAAFQITGW